MAEQCSIQVHVLQESGLDLKDKNDPNQTFVVNAIQQHKTVFMWITLSKTHTHPPLLLYVRSTYVSLWFLFEPMCYYLQKNTKFKCPLFTKCQVMSRHTQMPLNWPAAQIMQEMSQITETWQSLSRLIFLHNYSEHLGIRLRVLNSSDYSKIYCSDLKC